MDWNTFFNIVFWVLVLVRVGYIWGYGNGRLKGIDEADKAIRKRLDRRQ